MLFRSARDPALLLLDEPFGSLDALTRIRMHSLVRALRERYRPITLLVTHDVDEALLLADRVVVLHDGRLTYDVMVSAERRRSAPSFAEQRAELLNALGVDEDGPLDSRRG